MSLWWGTKAAFGVSQVSTTQPVCRAALSNFRFPVMPGSSAGGDVARRGSEQENAAAKLSSGPPGAENKKSAENKAASF
jgi:hypothetical protein